jgi:hypothetical protein
MINSREEIDALTREYFKQLLNERDSLRRQIEALKLENQCARVQLKAARALLETFADVAPENDYYKLPNGMTTGQLRARIVDSFRYEPVDAGGELGLVDGGAELC